VGHRGTGRDRGFPAGRGDARARAVRSRLGCPPRAGHPAAVLLIGHLLQPVDIRRDPFRPRPAALRAQRTLPHLTSEGVAAALRGGRGQSSQGGKARRSVLESRWPPDTWLGRFWYANLGGRQFMADSHVLTRPDGQAANIAVRIIRRANRSHAWGAQKCHPASRTLPTELAWTAPAPARPGRMRQARVC
jgi:hypothetical protein